MKRFYLFLHSIALKTLSLSPLYTCIPENDCQKDLSKCKD